MTNDGLTVRLATRDEASVVRDIVLAAYAEHRGKLPIDSGAHVETVDDVVHKMRAGGAVLAEIGQRAVGSAQFTPESEHLYVGRVAVLPSHRRRGVASAMMLFLEGAARDRGLGAMRVGVRGSLPDNSRLYQSLGYEVVGVDPHPRGPDTVLTMIKRLS